MHDTLIIVGASGHGKVVLDIADEMNRWKKIVFLDDNESVEKVLNYEVIGTLEKAYKYKETADFFVAIGDNSVRRKIQEKLKKKKFAIVSLTHPSAVIGKNVELGVGTVIMPGVVVNPSTKIGNGCIVNTASVIEHDNVLKDYVHVSPGVKTGGTVYIGENSWIGIGSVVSNNLSISANTIVGAGSLVLEDIIDPGTYIGVPTRRKR